MSRPTTAPRGPEPPLRVAFAGGGTGGHLCPAVEVARALEALRPGSEVLFVGSDKPLERRILDPAGLPHAAVPSAAPAGGQVRFAWAQSRGVWQAWGLLRRFRPDVVLGLGGFPSAPGVLAARLLGLPIALFEPNAVAGRANVALARFAREAYVHWEETRLGCPLVRTGTPVGRGPRAGDALTRAEARRRLGLPPDRPAILVTGGSQGARALNAWVADSLPDLGAAARDVAFVHLAGSEEAAGALRAAYRRAGLTSFVAAFTDAIGVAYRAAELAVVRGGGASLAELLAVGLPGLVVPLPSSAGDHQRVNARAFAATGAGAVVEEADLGPRTLADAVRLLGDRDALLARRARALAAARPDAAGAICERLIHLAAPAAGVASERRAA